MNPTTSSISMLTRRAFVRQAAAALTFQGVSGLGATATPSSRHRILCCDYEGNKIAIVDGDGRVEWEHGIQTPQDCWMRPNGNALVCYRHGAMEITPQHAIAWEYKAPSQAQCHSCQPLKNGNVLVAECGMSRIVEVGSTGQIAKEIPIVSKAKNMGHQFRGTRQTADGHYWVCLMDEQKILELSPAGTLLREIPIDGYPHAAIRLPNQHLLVTLGPTKRVVELDKKLKVVWQIDGNDIPGNPLRLPAGCQRLRNGNTIISNYLPGPFLGKQPQAFEITREKRVVWEFTDHARFKTVNQIFVLDGSGGRAGKELR
jgi:hypothetical protein